MIVQKQKSISQIKLAASIRTDISTILTGAGITPDTTNVLTMPKIPISFTCDEEDYSDFEIAKTGVNKQTPFDVIFAPDLVEGPTLVTWTKEFKMPFKVTNFLYLTDAQIRYIFVFTPGNSKAKQIFANLPDEINKESIQPGMNVVDKNNYKVKFIFFEGYTDSAAFPFKTMADNDVTAIEILTDTIKFYKKTSGGYFQSEGEVLYPKDEEDVFLYGAIFSNDKTFFECNLKKALKRLSVVARVFAEREEELAQNTQFMIGNCLPASYYKGSSGKYYTSELADFTETCLPNLNCNFNQINSIKSSLQTNNDILLGSTCALIY